jgi:phosphate starvation-inducible protein PhoH and related proteins
LIQDPNTNMVFVNGPAGTAKTYVAVYGALQLLKRGKVDEIVYIRSIIESASRSMGALPGDQDEKFSPYTMPLVDKLHEIVSRDQIKSLFGKELIRAVPVNYTRGLTFNKGCVIIDEAQNLTKKELITILTRFGMRSTYIVCGDTFQNDIRDTGFEEIMTKFDTPKSQSHNIHCMEFGKDEIVRSAILKYIVSVLEG